MSDGRARSGKATAKKMTQEQLKERAMKGVEARKAKAELPKVSYKGELRIGDIIMPCYVLDDETRVLSGRGLQDALALVDDAPHAQKAGSRLPRLFNNQSLKPFLFNGLALDHYKPIECYDGSTKINGYNAELLADICDAVLEARKEGAINTPRMKIIADQCELLSRAFMRVGITALVDEATGYQAVREKHDLAKIFEAFVAKELQPWVKTFPDSYYKELFRLYELPEPKAGDMSKPQFFGKVTNKVIYKKLAPEVLDELKKEAKKEGKKGSRLHQHLTPTLGHPKLREIIGMVVGIAKFSENREQFFERVDLTLPDYDENYVLDLNS